MKCCVAVCTSKSSKGCNISFHPLPKQQDRHESWLNSLGIPKQSLIKNKDLRVCSKHFLEGDYLFGTNIKKLKKSAVPFSINENINQTHNSEVKCEENVEDTIILKKRKLDTEGNICCPDVNCHTNDKEIISSLQRTINGQREEIETLKLQVSALQKEVDYLMTENERVKATASEVDTKSPFFTFVKLEDIKKKLTGRVRTDY